MTAFGSDDPYRRVIEALRVHGMKVTESGNSASTQCPAHDDRNASMSVSRGDRQPVVLHCHRGVPCPPDAIIAKIGLTWADVSAPQETKQLGDDRWMPCGHTKVAEYQYRDRRNRLVFAVARCSEKGVSCQGFRQWRPDPGNRSGKRWTRKLPDGTRVGEGLIYRLPEILDSDAMRNVWVVEGEKDADRLWSLGVPATCNAEGAGKWTQAHAAWLAGRDIIIVADHDDVGWEHAQHVAETLDREARSVEIVHSAKGKDVSNHLNGGHHLSAVVTVVVAKSPPVIGPGGEDLA